MPQPCCSKAQAGTATQSQPNLFRRKPQMRRISIQRLLFAIVLTLAIVALPTIVRAHHAWSDYHWARTANPFTVKMGNNVSGAWQTSFTNASSEWNSSSVVHNQIVAGGTKRRNCRPTSGRDE